MAGANTLFVSLLILIVALSILCVHKKVFVQPDGVSITVLEEDVGQANKTFTFSAIWSVRQGNGLWYRPSRRSMHVLLRGFHSKPRVLRVPWYIFSIPWQHACVPRVAVVF